jgi:hypothetical protein
MIGINDHQPPPMTKELIFMIERFPAHQMKIIELYDRDPDFRQVCNDYCLSVKMLDAFIKTEPEIKKVQQDYEQVSKDLKAEIMHFFENKN